jgi:hypothetical protein
MKINIILGGVNGEDESIDPDVGFRVLDVGYHYPIFKPNIENLFFLNPMGS